MQALATSSDYFVITYFSAKTGRRHFEVKGLPLDVESEARTDVSDEPMEIEESNEDDHESKEKDDGGSVYEPETETTESEMESNVEKRTGRVSIK